MGVFKNLFYYELGKSMSKKHPTAAGIGMVTLSILSDIEKEENLEYQKEIQKSKQEFQNQLITAKNQMLKDFDKIYEDNKGYMGDVYKNRFRETYNLIEDLNTNNFEISRKQIQSFLNDLQIRVYTVDTTRNMVQKLEDLPKGKAKEEVIKKVKEYSKKLDNTVRPKDCINLWEEMSEYMMDNGIELTNYEEEKEKLHGYLIKSINEI